MKTSRNDRMFLTPQGKHVVMDLLQDDCDALAARVAELEAALRLAETYVGKGVADGAFANCAMSGERALEKIAAALRGRSA